MIEKGTSVLYQNTGNIHAFKGIEKEFFFVLCSKKSFEKTSLFSGIERKGKKALSRGRIFS